MRVLMLPDFRAYAPYQSLLTASIELRNEFIETSKMHIFLSAADVVVLPYEKILTSGNLYLAMSYGKPIIAPKMGGIDEALGKATELLYEPHNK